MRTASCGMLPKECHVLESQLCCTPNGMTQELIALRLHSSSPGSTSESALRLRAVHARDLLLQLLRHCLRVSQQHRRVVLVKHCAHDKASIQVVPWQATPSVSGRTTWTPIGFMRAGTPRSDAVTSAADHTTWPRETHLGCRRLRTLPPCSSS